ASDRDSMPLNKALHQRRTVREFSRRPVDLTQFATLIHRTWGFTGWLSAGPLGRLALKTSPSAGALHPIECYVIAWRVRGLKPGLYHYDVRANELRLLKGGDLRET